MPAALDDDEQPLASRQPNRVASRGDADARPPGNLYERERARSPHPYFVRYDWQCRELADREAGGQGRGQGAGEVQPAAPNPARRSVAGAAGTWRRLPAGRQALAP